MVASCVPSVPQIDIAQNRPPRSRAVFNAIPGRAKLQTTPALCILLSNSSNGYECMTGCHLLCKGNIERSLARRDKNVGGIKCGPDHERNNKRLLSESMNLSRVERGIESELTQINSLRKIGPKLISGSRYRAKAPGGPLGVNMSSSLPAAIRPPTISLTSGLH